MEKECTDKRAAIIQAAMYLIAENGFHGAPTAMIAQQAEVGAGTIYRYFADKDELISAVHHDVEERINTVLQAHYPIHGTVRERLNYYYTGLIRYFLQHLVDFKFLGQFYNSPYGIALRRDKIFEASKQPTSTCEPIALLFEKGIEEGDIKNLPLAILFSLFFGTLTSIIRDHVQGFVVLDDELIQKTASVCWDALRA